MVKDNGPGIPGEPDQVLNNGVGLANTVERLEKLYGNNQQFHMENIQGRGFQVVIEIPFRISTSSNSEEAEN
jgi:sensor histidine kinase YesM